METKSLSRTEHSQVTTITIHDKNNNKIIVMTVLITIKQTSIMIITTTITIVQTGDRVGLVGPNGGGFNNNNNYYYYSNNSDDN